MTVAVTVLVTGGCVGVRDGCGPALAIPRVGFAGAFPVMPPLMIVCRMTVGFVMAPRSVLNP